MNELFASIKQRELSGQLIFSQNYKIANSYFHPNIPKSIAIEMTGVGEMEGRFAEVIIQYVEGTDPALHTVRFNYVNQEPVEFKGRSNDEVRFFIESGHMPGHPSTPQL